MISWLAAGFVFVSSVVASAGDDIALELLGTGTDGVSGKPAWTVQGLPVVDGPFDVGITNGPAASPGLVLVGSTLAPTTITKYGVTLHAPDVLTTVPITLNVDGEAALLAGPVDSALAGLDLVVQAGLFDDTATGGVAFTNGLAFRAGTPVAPIFNGVRIDAGNEPRGVTAADITGDGHLDIVATSYLSDAIIVVAGDGNGNVTPFATWPAGDGPSHVAVGDVDGDGTVDVVCANTLDGTLTIVTERGATTRHINTLASPSDLALGDLDDDGHLDVVVASGTADAVTVALGNGNGTFSAPTTVTNGDGPSTFALSDVNGDGRLDLLVAVMNDNGVAVLLGDGDGTFTFGSFSPTGSGPSDIKVGDLDGDGVDDIMTSSGFLNDDMTALLGVGDGTFEDGQVVLEISTVRAFELADLTNDGILDVVTMESTSAQRYTGRGNLLFASPKPMPAGVNPRHVAIADINADGQLDVLTSNTASDDVSVILNTGSSFRANSFELTSSTATAAITADVNGDGWNDIVFGAFNGVGVLIGDAHGDFEEAPFLLTGSNTSALVTGDFNNDGHVDVAFTSLVFGATLLTAAFGDGTGALTLGPTLTDVNMGVRSLAFGDVNGDTIGDLLIGAHVGVRVLLGQGDGTFDQQPMPVSFGANVVDFVLVDLDGDEQLDLAATTTGPDVGIRLGLGDGTFDTLSTVPVGDDTRALAAADIDGNGTLDLAVADMSNDRIATLLNDGHAGFGAPDFTPSPNPPALDLADFDGDGHIDLVSIDAADYAMIVQFGVGDGTFRSQLRAPLGGERLFVGDIDSDGDLDVGSASGVIFVHLNRIVD